MVQMTDRAVGKVREIMASQEPAPAGLRIAVVGGGCMGDVDRGISRHVAIDAAVFFVRAETLLPR